MKKTVNRIFGLHVEEIIGYCPFCILKGVFVCGNAQHYRQSKCENKQIRQLVLNVYRCTENAFREVCDDTAMWIHAADAMRPQLIAAAYPVFNEVPICSFLNYPICTLFDGEKREEEVLLNWSPQDQEATLYCCGMRSACLPKSIVHPETNMTLSKQQVLNIEAVKFIALHKLQIEGSIILKEFYKYLDSVVPTEIAEEMVAGNHVTTHLLCVLSM